eukprot:5786293-Pyramimonas_sp.AAC.1
MDGMAFLTMDHHGCSSPTDIRSVPLEEPCCTRTLEEITEPKGGDISAMPTPSRPTGGDISALPTPSRPTDAVNQRNVDYERMDPSPSEPSEELARIDE